MVTEEVTRREKLVKLARNTAAKLKGVLEWSNRTDSDRRIGVTQFRSLADACHQAMAVIEIEALIEYQRGRSQRAAGQGWASPIGHANEDAAALVLAAMKDVVKELPGNVTEADKLAELARFFGYLYRAAFALKEGKKEEGARR